MFKVECPACKAPYQVDERRVPMGGLKMRCPKCGSSFQVHPPSADPTRPAAPADVIAPSLGMGGSPPEAPVEKPPMPRKRLRGTMIGVAPPTVKGAERPVPVVPPPAAAPRLPRPVAAPDPELDLPVRAGVGAPRASSGELELDLSGGPGGSAPDEGGDLPAVSEGSFARRGQDFADLPAPASRKPPLPQVRHAPAPNVELDDLGLDLPSPALEMDLPSPGVARRSGTSTPGQAARPADLPATPARESPFGEIELPSLGGELPSLGGELPSLGGELPSLGGELPSLGAGPPVLSERELPAFGGGAPRRPSGAGLPAVGEPFGEEADPFGEAPLHFPDSSPAAARAPFPQEAPGPSPAPPAPEVLRASGGGTGYGEVNLDESAGSVVAIEGTLREEVTSGEFSELPMEQGAPASLPRARAKDLRGSDREQMASQRRRWIVGIFAVAALTIGGSALTLVPDAGPFGAYFIVDQIRRGDHERQLAATVTFAHARLGLDTYLEAEKAMTEAVARARTATRFKPLAAYAAFTGFARVLRFGPEGPVYARAAVALNELALAKGVRELDLARATRAAVDGDLGRSRAALSVLAQASPRDLDVAVVRGEVELRAKDAKAATFAWTSASALEKSGRTTFGLARAALLGGDSKRAEALAAETLTLSPSHIGARLLLAETAWSSKQEEPLATKLVGEVMQHADQAGPEERIEAQTLLGEIHLSRGRMTQAEQAFGEAIGIAEAVKLNAQGARALSGLGEALFRAGRYSQAVARFKAAVQADPEDVTGLVGVAKSNLLLERIDDARDLLGKLVRSHPKDAHVAYWNGRLEEARGERKAAEAAYLSAIALGRGAPDTVDAYIALASVLSADGQPEAANSALADAQARVPGSPGLFKALGRVAMAQGRYADALTAFEKAQELGADDLEARFLRATALVRLREFDRALEAFDAVAKVDRDFPGLALERGVLFQESGRTEEALREYEAALSKAPNDPDLMLRVGCGKATAGGGEAAETMLRRVLEQRPNSTETHFCLGRAMLERHDFADATKEFERAIQLDPNHAEYHLYLGRACIESGSLTKASASLERALELDQGLADAYWQRGVLRLRQTRPKDALVDLTKALTLRPSRAEAHADLALAYYDLGKEDLALAEWQTAISAKPNEATWRFHYGRLLNLRLQNAAAAEQLDKAIELVSGSSTPPPWLSEAHRIAAVCRGSSRAAIPHWQAFLKTSPANSPYRNEAKAALRRLGAPYED